MNGAELAGTARGRGRPSKGPRVRLGPRISPELAASIDEALRPGETINDFVAEAVTQLVAARAATDPAGSAA